MRTRVWTPAGYEWSENVPSEVRSSSFSGQMIVGQSGTRDKLRQKATERDYRANAAKGWDTRRKTQQ